MSIFDSKNWNAEVFGKYLETVPRVKQNAFLRAGILRNRSDLSAMLNEQTGGNFITIPMTGLIGGTALNYDGDTDITATGIDTYLQSMIVVGRAKAWQEKDFSYELTGKDFMADIAGQVANYWDDIDQKTILAILEGIFKVTTNSFASKHTLDITSASTATVGATTLNDAITAASGANKSLFTMAIMHSAVAKTLENLQVLTYWQETDANGVQRPVGLASWNGRTVLIDDDVPAEAKGSGSSAYTEYTTYLLGQNAFDYVDCGAKVPNETWRDPKTDGGLDWLITRQRKLFAPRGFSFVQPQTPVISPTDAQLATASFWTPVVATDGSTYFDSKAYPFARILSKG